jgi:hypothetical protein
MDRDREHLKMLAIFHYVISAFAFLFGCFFLLYAAFGGFMLRRPDLFTNGGRGEPPPPIVGGLLMGLGLGAFAMGLAFAILLLVAGRSLARQTRYAYCFAVACLCCLFTPWGTVLGVFTLVVLSRPGAKQLFGRAP